MRPFLSADLHAESITYAVFLGTYLMEEPRRIKNTIEALDQLSKEHPGALLICEACGFHEFVYDELTSMGMTVRAFEPPRREKKDRKNDRKDALRLGRRFVSNELREVWIPPLQTRRLRSLVQTRVRQARLSSSEQARIQMTLHHQGFWKRNPSVPKKPLNENIRKQILEALPWLEVSYGIIDLVQENIKLLDRRIQGEGSQIEAVRRLRSITGFGPLVSLAYYATIGDVRRFPTADHVVSYVGIDPVWSQSGDRLRDHHRISHKGNDEMRALLNQAAWAHVNFAPESDLTKTYRRKERTMGSQKAVTGLMGDLAKAAYAVWSEDRDFTMKRPTRLANCRTPPAQA